jgi:hypothetical protein
VLELPPDGRRARRNVRRRIVRQGLCARARGEERRERGAERARERSHPARRSGILGGWGHITRIVPITKT